MITNVTFFQSHKKLQRKDTNKKGTADHLTIQNADGWPSSDDSDVSLLLLSSSQGDSTSTYFFVPSAALSQRDQWFFYSCSP